MNIKRLIAKLLPQSILQALQLRRDRKQLSALPSRECDTENLREVTADQLANWFADVEIESLWNETKDSLEKFAVPDMTGGVNPGDRRALFYLATALEASSVLEIGTHIGASTIHLASALQATGNRGGQQPSLTTVDISDVNDDQRRPWIEHGSKHSPAQMIESLGCSDFVQFETSTSLNYLNRCQQNFDLIFLDGDHSATTTYLEIPIALRRLNPGGAILLHDFFPDLEPLWSNGKVIHGPFLAVDRLIGEANSIQAIPLGKLPWPTKLDSHFTSLALLVASRI